MVARTRAVGWRWLAVPVVLLGFGVLNSGPVNQRSGSEVDSQLVALLAGHAQREADLATVAAQRDADPSVVQVAVRVRDAAKRHVTALLGLLERVGLDTPTRGVLFAASVGGQDRITVGSVSYLCHLSGSLDDDVTTLKHDDVSAITSDWTEFALDQFIAAVGFGSSTMNPAPATARILADYQHWHRPLFGALAPLLPVTDQQYARNQAAD